jgi:phospholipid-transporting ATPase
MASDDAHSTDAQLRNFRVIDAEASLQGEQLKYASNTIKTTKYSLYPWRITEFFPFKMLYEQFQRKANLYFLIVGLMQLVPGLSPTGRYTTLATLIGVLIFSAIKAAYEDIQRYSKDNEINNRVVYVLHDAVDNTWKECRYTDVKVGDIIYVSNIADENGKRRNDLPCDLIMLSSSDPEGVAYVETANLDGETNLKGRRCLDETRVSRATLGWMPWPRPARSNTRAHVWRPKCRTIPCTHSPAVCTSQMNPRPFA